MKFPQHSRDVLPWAKAQPWYAEMAATPQDAVWHAEGDVATHVDMVMGEVLNLNTLEDRKYKLALAAVFHDIAKPRCTVIEGDRVRSPGHGRKGASMFVTETFSELQPQMRRELYHLIRLHGKPPHALAGDYARELALWSQDVDTSMLLDFVTCDLRGRTCADKADLLLQIDLLRTAAQEIQCLTQPYVFANAEAKIWANTDRLPHLEYAPHFPDTHTVYILQGLPGSGKDYYYRKHLSNFPVISLDDLRTSAAAGDIEKNQIYAVAKEQARQHLAAKQSFVFNATNLTRSLRLKWMNLFYQYGATDRKSVV